MHVGYWATLENGGGERGDAEVYANELRLVDIAVDLGFESVWALEHHFSDYAVCPDPIQFLTWVGSRHRQVRLGTAVIVLPWHDPTRCTEQIAMLDNLSEGRLILGIGRGIAQQEYEGMRVPMEDSRARFTAYASMILEALETGVVQADNEFIVQPRREIRPQPSYSFRGRTYAAAMSPESLPVMADLGVGVFVIPQKPWETVAQDYQTYQHLWDGLYGTGFPPPPLLCAGQVFVHSDVDRAEEMAFRYCGSYYRTVMHHYGFDKKSHAGIKGYEFYAGIGNYISRHGTDEAVTNFVKLMPYGTPDQVLEKMTSMRELLDLAGIQLTFCFGGMPYNEAEESLRLFAAEILPVAQAWESEPLLDPEPLVPQAVAPTLQSPRR